MSLILEVLLDVRTYIFNTELDYRLTQLELYELGASDDTVAEFRTLFDEGRLEAWRI